MTETEFIEELEMVLNEEPGTVSGGSALADMSGYDSTGMLGVIALMDEIGARVNVDELRKCAAIDDLVTLAKPSFGG